MTTRRSKTPDDEVKIMGSVEELRKRESEKAVNRFQQSYHVT